MLYSLKDRLRRTVFGHRIRKVLATEPLTPDDALNLHVLTQLQHKDVLMYLAALKSFARRVPIAQVHVLNDGTLDDADQAILDAHVPGVRIRSIAEFRDAALPAGGTWERLSAVAQLSETAYVVQLDADTVTRGDLPEVVDAIATQRSFTIGTWDGQTMESALYRSSRAREMLNKGVHHVQVRAEAALDRLDGAVHLKYVRGCSGFAGFAASPGKVQFIREMSRQMKHFVGPAWAEWGSEQFMSNLLAANLPRAIVLPHPEYCDCSKIRDPGSRFIHFIGSCRFNGGRYAEMVKLAMSV